MRLFGLAVLALTLAAVSADAAGYSLHADGYYRYGNGVDRYTRSQVYQAGYYSGCTYYPGYYYYQYSLAPAAYTAPYVAPTTAAEYDTLEAQIVAFAKAKDLTIAKERLLQLRHANAAALIKTLGLEGDRAWAGYGQAVPYPYASSYVPRYGHNQYAAPMYGNLQYSSAGVQGNSVYGYTSFNAADFWGDRSTAVLYQALGRTLDNTPQLFKDALQGTQEIVIADGERKAKVAEILARGQALAGLARSLDGEGGKITSRSFTFKVGPNGETKIDPQPAPQQPGAQGAQGAQPPGGESTLAAWQASAQKCVGCHGGNRSEGNFRVENYLKMDVASKLNVIERILTRDEKRRMPRNPDGSAGVRLTPEEIIAWLSN